MKFLVIGASGFIGGHVLAHVRSRGFTAVGTQSKPRNPDLITFNLAQDRIHDCVGQEFFADGAHVCMIICAVVSNMDRCLLERDYSYRINVVQTVQLIEDVLPFGAKVVFLSTCFAFDGTIGYYNESQPVSPVNEYARHKVELEKHLQQHVPNAFIARLEKVVSDKPDDRQLFAQWQQLAQAGQPIVCIKGSLLSPTYVGDVARALTLVCERNLSGLYHVCNSEFFYRDELARQFCHAMGWPPKVEQRALEAFQFPDRRALKSYLDGSQFAELAGMRFTPMSTVFRSFRTKVASLTQTKPSPRLL
jgi:dTDP-4-dehydrorhamnose reductase